MVLNLHLVVNTYSCICGILSSSSYLAVVIEGNNVASSSTNWNLSKDERMKIRYEGYCMKLCSIGYDSENDRYDIFMQHYYKTKAEGTFDSLHSHIIDGDFNDDDKFIPLLWTEMFKLKQISSLNFIKHLTLTFYPLFYNCFDTAGNLIKQ